MRLQADQYGPATPIRPRLAIRAVAIFAGLGLIVTLGGCASKNQASVKPSSPLATTSALVSRAAAKKPVAPPVPGNISETLPRRSVPTQSPVAINATASFGHAVTARVVSITHITAQAHIPGEVSGAAIAMKVQLHNGSDRSINVGQVAVAVTGPKGKPENQISQNGSKPVAGTLAVGKDASGVYVFSVATQDQSLISVSISYSADVPTVLFVGRAR